MGTVMNGLMSNTTISRILDRLGGVHEATGGWYSRCPAHDDRKASLSITVGYDGRVLLHCFAGCGPEDIVRAAGLNMTDLFPHGQQRDNRGDFDRGRGDRHPGARGAGYRSVRASAPANVARALDIWQASRPAPGTVVECYLTMRGLTGPIPTSLRYASLYHGGAKTSLPAMVAAVTRWPHDEPQAMHRTYLRPDGSAKADVTPNRMALAPIHGGAVRLAPAGEALVVAEGIETALSVQQTTGISAWAVLGVSNLKNLVLPPLPMASEVIIAADPDHAGRRAAEQAAERWSRDGRRVRIALPPDGFDFNDLLRRGV